MEWDSRLNVIWLVNSIQLANGIIYLSLGMAECNSMTLFMQGISPNLLIFAIMTSRLKHFQMNTLILQHHSSLLIVLQIKKRVKHSIIQLLLIA